MFRVGFKVLVRWIDRKLYFCKVIRQPLKPGLDYRVAFEDLSQYEVSPMDIFDVKATIEDIPCTKCLGLASKPGDKMISCVKCVARFHQHCHEPPILNADTKWTCQLCLEETTPGIGDVETSDHSPSPHRKRKAEASVTPTTADRNKLKCLQASNTSPSYTVSESVKEPATTRKEEPPKHSTQQGSSKATSQPVEPAIAVAPTIVRAKGATEPVKAVDASQKLIATSFRYSEPVKQIDTNYYKASVHSPKPAISNVIVGGMSMKESDPVDKANETSSKKRDSPLYPVIDKSLSQNTADGEQALKPVYQISSGSSSLASSTQTGMATPAIARTTPSHISYHAPASITSVPRSHGPPSVNRSLTNPLPFSVGADPIPSSSFLNVPLKEQFNYRNELLFQSLQVRNANKRVKKGLQHKPTSSETSIVNAPKVVGHICAKCSAPASYLCSICCRTWYCNQTCQNVHWDVHKSSCIIPDPVNAKADTLPSRNAESPSKAPSLAASSNASQGLHGSSFPSSSVDAPTTEMVPPESGVAVQSKTGVMGGRSLVQASPPQPLQGPRVQSVHMPGSRPAAPSSLPYAYPGIADGVKVVPRISVATSTSLITRIAVTHTPSNIPPSLVYPSLSKQLKAATVSPPTSAGKRRDDVPHSPSPTPTPVPKPCDDAPPSPGKSDSDRTSGAKIKIESPEPTSKNSIHTPLVIARTQYQDYPKHEDDSSQSDQEAEGPKNKASDKAGEASRQDSGRPEDKLATLEDSEPKKDQLQDSSNQEAIIPQEVAQNDDIVTNTPESASPRETKSDAQALISKQESRQVPVDITKAEPPASVSKQETPRETPKSEVNTRDTPRHDSSARKPDLRKSEPKSESKQIPAIPGRLGEARCIICNKPALCKCSNCATQFYCGRDCQLKAWPQHRLVCVKMNRI